MSNCASNRGCNATPTYVFSTGDEGMIKDSYVWCLNNYHKGDNLGYELENESIRELYLLRENNILINKGTYKEYEYKNPVYKYDEYSDLELFVKAWSETYNQEPLNNKGMSRYVVLDLETTGFSPNTSNIIEIGAWKVVDGVTVSEFTELVKPPYGIPLNVVALTHITDDMVKDARPIKEVLPEFVDWLEDYPLLGHNLNFDYEFLKRGCEVTGDDVTLNNHRRGIDTLKLCRELYNFESNKLGDIAKEFNINIAGNNLHRARYDAYITKQVYERIVASYGSIMRVSIPSLLDENKKGKGVCEDGEVISFY